MVTADGGGVSDDSDIRQRLWRWTLVAEAVVAVEAKGRVPRQGNKKQAQQGNKNLSGLYQAVIKNIDACKELSTITRTSLGPY
ncbi:T-complex protein 1 subunit theta-like protein, partial [Tanacetum coccineum]